MKNKKIRKAVFETNSSSSHSLHIDDSVDVYETLPIESGYIDELEEVVQNAIIIKGDEFGWQWEKFNDAQTKASYLATMLLTLEDMLKYIQGKPGDEISQYGLYKFAASDYLECRKNFEEAIKEQTGALEVVVLGTTNWNDGHYSYIDHQSFEDASDGEILLDKEKIRQFIFNPKSALHTGNDNSSAPLNFYCNDNEAKYKMRVEGFGNVGNLTDKESSEELLRSVEALIDDDDLWSFMVNTENLTVTAKSGWGKDGVDKTFNYTIEDV